MNDVFTLGIITGFLLALVVFVLVGFTRTEHWQTEAVKAGKAEYYLDSNNNKQWRWK